jgi:hypothetical protein
VRVRLPTDPYVSNPDLPMAPLPDRNVACRAPSTDA